MTIALADPPIDSVNHELSDEARAEQTATDPAAGEPSPPEPSPPKAAPPALLLSELKRRHYEEIVVLNRQVGEAWHEWQEAKAESSEMKKGYDGLVQQLRKTVARDPAQRDIFELSDATATNSADAPLGNDSLKLVKIELLECGKSATSKLATHGIETLDQLQDFWTAGKDLKDLKGIGEETAAKIADAFADFGTKHPELWEAPTDAADQEDDAAAPEDDAADPEDDEDDEDDDISDLDDGDDLAGEDPGTA